jgi:hypothetical protein
LARKKNIAIDDDVYESLLDIGSKRDTFSDIIRKCIDAYETLQHEKRRPIEKVDEHYAESDRQLQPQHDEPVIHSSRYEAAKPRQPEQEILEINIHLPGIEFPTDRSKIIKYAEEANTDRVNRFLKSISDRRYKNKSDLINELSDEGKLTKVNFIKEDGIVIFKIDDRKLRKEQYKEKRLEQENKIGK